MKILALQLKRIGDAILTAPALAAIKSSHPEAEITLVLDRATAPLAPAFTAADHVAVYRRGRPNLEVWARVAGGPFDACLDFCGTDRSAAMTLVSRATHRVGYARACTGRPALGRVYNRLSGASVRDLPTVAYHLALAESAGLIPHGTRWNPDAPAGFAPPADVPAPAGLPRDIALVHPGTARHEKFWFPDRWAKVIADLTDNHGLPCAVTGGGGQDESRHLDAIRAAGGRTLTFTDLNGKLSLLELAALTRRARVALSVDSAAAHLTAAARSPQVTLFGPTNPFHWAPRHGKSLVVCASHDDVLPVEAFLPRAPGAPMRRLSTSTVIRATGCLLAR